MFSAMVVEAVDGGEAEGAEFTSMHTICHMDMGMALEGIQRVELLSALRTRKLASDTDHGGSIQGGGGGGGATKRGILVKPITRGCHHLVSC